jgi:pentatricopeptide repeat protein
VYKMLHEYDIKGTAEVYTIALRSCSLTGDLGFALKIYDDMNKIGVKPDEVFFFLLGSLSISNILLSRELFDLPNV